MVGENGSGKSTMLDAIIFALYGRPYRSINKPLLVNSITQKNTRVELLFSIRNKDYKVVRGIKPNIFEIYENDVLIDQSANVKDYQEILEKRILKLNLKSFTQIVVVGSAGFVPFMQLNPADRRSVIEDLLDIDIFTKMFILLKDKITNNKQLITNTTHSIELLEQKINLIKKHIQDIKNINQKDNDDKQVKIDYLNKKIEISRKKITDTLAEIKILSDSITDNNKVNLKNKKLSELKFQFKHKVDSIEKEIKFFDEKDDCPTCNQHIDSDFKKKKISECKHKKEELVDANKKLILEIDAITKRIDEITTIQTQINTLNTNILTENMSINIDQNTVKQLQLDIKSVNINLDLTEKQNELSQFNGELKNTQDKNKELVDTRTLYDIASMLLKDGGIKTKIIKQYVPVINKLVNKYLASLEFFVQFELDEQFNERIRSRFRDDFTYSSFSEGEKMRIDLSLLFTWRAVAKLRNSASTNLLILDEVFDSSLDYTGTDEFLKLLEQLTSDTNVFVISHKGDQLFDKFHSVIRFEKVKNFSRIAA